MEKLNSRNVDGRTRDCRHAYQQALNWYRHAGIVRLASEFADSHD
jgi:hypothetical protein